jgi:hypothetical protein
MRYVAVACFCSVVVCTTPAAPVPKARDGFYKPGWDRPIDPDNDCKFTQAKGRLTIEVPGKDHDFDPRRGKLNAPRLLRPVEGDFVLVTRIRGPFRASAKSSTEAAPSHAAAGVLIEVEDKARTRIRFQYGVTREGGEPSQFTAYICQSLARPRGGFSVSNGDPNRWPIGDAVYLRLERQGTTLHGHLGPDGKRWFQVAQVLMEGLPPKLKVGLLATSTSQIPLTVTFDEFKLEEGKRPPK